MWYRKIVWLLLWGGLHIGTLWSQSSVRFPNLRYLTTDEGLSQNEVTCILQDRMGFLWIGTRGGLNRYDGYEFKVYQNEVGNPNSLVNNSIESLFEDSQGRIWVGTKSNGLSCYYPDRDKFEHYQVGNESKKGISGNRIIALAEGSRGDIWVGTWQNGLSIIPSGTGEIRHLMGSTRVEDIAQTQDGTMWLATDKGLFHFSSQGELQKRFLLPQTRQNCVSILEDTIRNSLYLGTWNSGVFEFDLSEQGFRPFQMLNKQGVNTRLRNAYHLYQDSEHQIWVGTWGQGVFRIKSEKRILEKYDLGPRGLNMGQELYRDVLCTFQDRSGVLWLGTNGGGLCRVDQAASQFGYVRYETPDLALPQEPVWAVHKDAQNVLWIGSRGKPSVFFSRDEGQSFQRLSLNSLINQVNQSSMKEGGKAFLTDNKARLWVGTNHGLAQIIPQDDGYRLELHALKIAGDSIDRPIRRVSIMHQSSDGTFWVGTQQNGLRRSLHPGTPANQAFVSYFKKNKTGSLQSNRISSILEDRKNRHWIGTYGGLHLYRPEFDDFAVFQKRSQDSLSLSSDIIICLHEDKSGQLWVGTPNGLNRADWNSDGTLSFRCFQEKDGLPNNYIHAILEDEKGKLWVSTNRGISCFDSQEESFENYDVNDGLQSNSFMEGVACKDKQGRFYFGGIYGLNFFHPDSIISRIYTPPVALTSLKVFNEEVKVGDTLGSGVVLTQAIEYTSAITLEYEENVLTLEFAALDFHAPERIIYEYKLEGLEKNWNQVNQQRSVTYTHLRAGTYTFRVKAASPQLDWQPQEAQLIITVLPAFWATWQAFLLYAIMFIGILALYRSVIRRQNELKNSIALERVQREKDSEMAEMKTRFFTNITHELRTPLTLISGPVEQMIQERDLPNKLRDYLLTMHHNTQRLLKLVNQLLDFRKAETNHMELQVSNGDFAYFAHEVFLSFQDLADRQETHFSFSAEPETIELYFDRNKMEIVLSNLLSNAFKYSPSGSHIEFKLSKVEDQYCEIIVSDNGRGMSAEVVENIFDRFYQVVNAESVNIMSTGIGLSLVKTIVDLHQGSVSVQSEIQAGSTFSLQLPLGREHFEDVQIISDFKDAEHESHYQRLAASSMTSPSEERSLKPSRANSLGKLLLVEDNPEIRAFLRSIFQEEFEIVEAENGRIGLAVAEESHPDIIISDIMMPEMDGQAFCKALREHDDLSHLPVILLTARTSPIFEVEGYQSGADAYITKPFKPSVLKAQVESLLSARQRLKQYFSQKVTLQPTELEIAPRDKDFLDKVMKLVEENLLNEKLSRDYLADAMAMSPSTLYRKLKTLTDLTTNAFIRSIRLKRAAQLLEKSQYNISEIAYLVGFNDLKYFRTCFKEQFGVNPSEYADSQAASSGEFA
ncbi:MAG: two-component regulator propeller domain-containing protein [Bacteroidia bacterium]